MTTIELKTKADVCEAITLLSGEVVDPKAHTRSELDALLEAARNGAPTEADPSDVGQAVADAIEADPSDRGPEPSDEVEADLPSTLTCPGCGHSADTSEWQFGEGPLAACAACPECGAYHNVLTGERVEDVPVEPSAKRRLLNPQPTINRKKAALEALERENKVTLEYDRNERLWFITSPTDGDFDPIPLTSRELAGHSAQSIVRLVPAE